MVNSERVETRRATAAGAVASLIALLLSSNPASAQAAGSSQLAGPIGRRCAK
jgi:uncharacterized membrane protein